MLYLLRHIVQAFTALRIHAINGRKWVWTTLIFAFTFPSIVVNIVSCTLAVSPMTTKGPSLFPISVQLVAIGALVRPVPLPFTGCLQVGPSRVLPSTGDNLTMYVFPSFASLQRILIELREQ